MKQPISTLMKRILTVWTMTAALLMSAAAQSPELGTFPAPKAATGGFANPCASLSGTGAFLMADLLSGHTESDIASRYCTVFHNGIRCIPAFVLPSPAASPAAFADYGVHLRQLSDGNATALIPVRNYVAFLQSGLCDMVDVSPRNKPALDNVRADLGIDAIYNGSSLPQAYNGTGVVVGIIDIGFEYGHPAFYDSTGSTFRVKRVWEQDASSGSSPSGFGYGRELTTQQAILNAQRSSTDESHGTHVAGIAAGCGGNTAAMRRFRGIAPQADIVMVATNMSASGIYDGIEYIHAYASSVGKPCVINMSLGSHIGPHDGTSAFDRECDSYFSSHPSGLLLVGSAGNEGDENLHIGKTFSATDTLLYALLDFDGSSAGTTAIDIWGVDNTPFMAGMGILNTNTGRFDAGGYFRRSSSDWTYTDTLYDADNQAMPYTIYCESSNPYNNRANITIYVDHSRQTSNHQRALLVLKGNSGTVHIWGSKCTFINGGFSSITAGDNSYTVTETGGTGNNIISVGAYTTRDNWTPLNDEPFDISYHATVGDITYFSSRGPLLDGRTKPDITAPGQMTIAPLNRFASEYISGHYATHRYSFNSHYEYFGAMQGTSMSAPVVTGIMALWLQRNPNLSPSQAIQLVHSTAINDSYTGQISSSGSNAWGWGKINPLGGLTDNADTASANALDTNSCLITSLPYSTDFDNGVRCWTLRNFNQDSITWGTIASYGYNSSSCIFINPADSADDWLYTPGIVVSGNLSVEWKAKSYNASKPNTYQVWLIGTDTSIRIFNETLSSTDFVDRNARFSIAPGDTAFIMFRYISNHQSAFFIDNVTIRVAPPTIHHTLTVVSNNPTMGSVSGGGSYDSGSQATLTATPASGHCFVRWQDDNTDNPRTVTVTANATYTAYFEVDALDTNSCLLTTLPYHMNFENGAPCWGVRDNNGDTNTWSIHSSLGYNSTACAYVLYAATSDDWLYTPGLVVPGNHVVEWKAKVYDADYPETYQVWMLTGDTSLLLFSETLSSTDFVDRSANFTVAPNDTAHIMFRYISDDQYAFFIDNVYLHTARTYTIAVASADPLKGSASGGGSFAENSTTTISATPNSGFRFLRWQDDNTDNPRTITVTANATYTAFFEAIQYTLTVTSDNPTMGSVSGGGSYAENATATLTATPNTGYRFLRWHDGNSDNPRSVTVTANASYTAFFETIQYTLTVVSDNPTMGSASGSGTYNSGASATLTASPNSGYRFVRWNDNITDNPRSVTVTANATYTAFFEANSTPAPTTFTLTVLSDDPTMGSASGGGSYNSGATATLSASPNQGFRFLRWNDNNTDNPRSVTVTANASYTAYFEPQQFTLTVLSDNPTMGSASGGGSYNSGSTATLSALPNQGFRFLRWNDNNTDNPRSVTVTADATYTAFFEAARYTVTVSTDDPSMGTASGGGSYSHGATATLTATPNTGFRFLRWNDGSQANPRSVTVTANASYTAFFQAESGPTPTTYTLTVLSNDTAMGSAFGGGTYSNGATATLSASAKPGFHFVGWHDGNSDNPRSVTVVGNATYTALFEADGNNGIDGIAEAGISITSLDGQIAVSTSDASLPAFTVCDVVGRVLFRHNAASDAACAKTGRLPDGVYFVHLEGMPARKVVLMR